MKKIMMLGGNFFQMSAIKRAKGLEIDGILSYASDVSASTAVYVAEKMGLPPNPYDAVMTLTQKQKFRKFMSDNHLLMPVGQDFCDKERAREFVQTLELLVMIT